jgi:hypothetical protein
MAATNVYLAVCQGVGCVACGLFGGILNHILVVRNLGLAAKDNRPESWEYGIGGDLLIGAGAGLLTFLYGYDLPMVRVMALALVGGVSGGNFWSNAMQIREFNKERERVQAYKQATETALAPPKRRRRN